MDTVILLFRLIEKIATVDGVARQPVQGGSIRGQVGLRPSPFDGLQRPIFVLEVLLGVILAVYASIAFSYALRYYKKSWYPTNSPAHDKPTENRYDTLYIDHWHEA